MMGVKNWMNNKGSGKVGSTPLGGGKAAGKGGVKATPIANGGSTGSTWSSSNAASKGSVAASKPAASASSNKGSWNSGSWNSGGGGGGFDATNAVALVALASMLQGGGGGGSWGGYQKKFIVDKSGGELGEFIGTIKSFGHWNNYGFIECPQVAAQGFGDIFLHGNEKKGFKPGQTVKFSCVVNKDGKAVAINLKSGLK
eukprot:TRINITY_DN10498_c0_g2_i1.p1 TRINITY_DN10498_c0_g2~~TRINITY_DN10498_c0_g2_i1.p1  ORF type:complete len:199 (-),score=63.41 TRINITY_DN10498_c0_g2_i1:117-713(-)